MTRETKRAIWVTVIVTGIVLVLIYLGSRGLRDFDPALIGYCVATVFAIAALTYRYTRWLSRPPTNRYFKAGWTTFLSWGNFRRYTWLIPKAWFTDIFGQTFILRRGLQRWLMHMSIFWGVLLSLLITVPLTFGWIRFTLVPPDHYRLWFFGVGMVSFPISAGSGFAVFHALDFTAALLIVGLIIAIWRRLSDAGLLATQRFSFDLMPLVLLMAIAITGLALTASYDWWGGAYYSFIQLTHEVVVVLWLLSLPFGKFFHIIERPASIGVTLYQQVTHDVEQERHEAKDGAGVCRRCGQPLPSARFAADLKGVLNELGQDYQLDDDATKLQDFCPTCKRIIRGQSYYEVLGRRFL